ncbi:MAG: hypothetical protein ABI905_18040 [Betaproteobacteria bacterium]
MTTPESDYPQSKIKSGKMTPVEREASDRFAIKLGCGLIAFAIVFFFLWFVLLLLVGGGGGMH